MNSVSSIAPDSSSIMRIFRRFRRTSLTFQLTVIALLGVAILFLGARLRSEVNEDVLLQNLRHEIRHGDKEGVVRDFQKLDKQAELSNKAMCGNSAPCKAGHYAYRIQTGMENKHRPQICLNDDYGVFPQIEMGRGLNILQIDGKTNTVKTKRSFDTYAGDSANLVAFLDNVPPSDVVMMVTFDDAINRLSQDGVKFLEEQFGSRQAHLLTYRSMWAFIGQRYQKHDGDHEVAMIRKPELQWGEQTEIKGCFSIPLGQRKEPSIFEKNAYQNLCSVNRVCETNEVAVHAESGRMSKGTKVFPKICFDGKTILSNYHIESVKPARRGINIVVVDPETGDVVSSGTFDTYDAMSQDMACADYLRSVASGMLVIAVTFDEASRQLGFNTKREFQRVGAAKVQDLGYREMWAFVGQKGISGISPYERVSEDMVDGWGTKAEIWDCIPKFINGSTTGGYEAGLKKKTEFCQKYLHSFRDMCSPVNIHRPIVPLELDDTSLTSNPAYATPIIVIPGSDLEALQRTLESLIAIPGLQSQMVVVVLEGNFPQPNELVGVYGFRAHYTKARSQYLYTIHAGMEEAMGLFPSEEYFIIIEEYVEVAPDFLRFFSQTLHLLDTDETLLTISAWNEHGFKHTSGDTGMLYRTDMFPGYGWVLRRSVWKAHMQHNEIKCCMDQTWRQWLATPDFRKGCESVVPDVSRVKRSIKPGIYEDRPFLEEYLSNRTITNDPSMEPTRTFYLKKLEYEKFMKKLVSESLPLDRNLFIGCETVGHTTLDLSGFSRGVYTLVYRQDSESDFRKLVTLAKCLMIYVYNGDTVRGLHNGVLRLMYQGQQLLLVGTKSPYYQYKISAVPY